MTRLMSALIALTWLVFLVGLACCGRRLEQEEFTEPMCLVFNSDAQPIPSPWDDDEDGFGVCRLVLSGETYSIDFARRRGASGAGCRIPLGSWADVTLLLVEGREPAPIDIRWR